MTKIIIADDEALIRKGLLSLIDWAVMDCEVVLAAANGGQVIENLDALRPDIVISDIRMPVMDGLQVAKYLYEHPEHGCKLILLTAFADFEYARTALQYGVSDYVTKDGDMDVIIEAVQKCKQLLAHERQAAVSAQDKIGVLLKSILDGAVFAADEIRQMAQQYRLFPTGYRVVCTELRCRQPLADSEFVRLRQNVTRLLHNEFAQDKHTIVPTGKHSLALVLDDANQPDAVRHCLELCGAVSGLTGLALYAGVSRPRLALTELRAAHQEAVQACELHVYDGGSVHSTPPDATRGTLEKTVYLNALQQALAAGSSAACEQSLAALFAQQKKLRSPLAELFACASALYALCRHTLERAGAQPGDHGHTEQGFCAALEHALLFEDFCAPQRRLVQDTCRAIAGVLLTDNNVIANAQSYITRHYSEAISLSDIAAAVGANPSYLSRAFKQKTGASIVDTITQKRMERAKELIREGRLKMYEISAAVGMDDAAYFSNVFHKYTGMYPKAYQDSLVK